MEALSATDHPTSAVEALGTAYVSIRQQALPTADHPTPDVEGAVVAKVRKHTQRSHKHAQRSYKSFFCPTSEGATIN